MPGFHRPLRRATVLATALLAVGLAGCGSSETSHTGTHGGGTHRPVTTSDADWKSVTDALGRTGKFGDSNTVYRIPLVRSDLQVVTVGVPIKPGLSLGGYVAFAKYDDATMVMGDLVVTEAELPKVTDALQSHGIAQTALHKHLLEQSPQMWWTHIHAMGDPAKLAAGSRQPWTQPPSRPRRPRPHSSRRSIWIPQASLRRWAAREIPTVASTSSTWPAKTPSSMTGT